MIDFLPSRASSLQITWDFMEFEFRMRASRTNSRCDFGIRKLQRTWYWLVVISHPVLDGDGRYHALQAPVETQIHQTAYIDQALVVEDDVRCATVQADNADFS